MTAGIDAPYELLELIGQGGMGQVFRARHTGLDRIEALKVLSAELASDQEFVIRLRREARATTLLTHPNIVSVYGFGRLPDGRYYLAMEYLQGETLETLCDRQPALPIELGMRLLYQLASAMAHAHEQDVVHRDLKPANLMIEDLSTGAPYLKVLDFGLAKIISPSYAESVAVSKTGSFHGTPGYMAPERVRGVPTDPRIDIYSFGCVAYTVLTGQAPFVGRGIDVLHAHQELLPPAPGKLRPLPAAIDDIVMCCLAKNPAERFSSGRTLCAALHAISGFSPERARRRSIPPPEPRPADAAAPTTDISHDTLRPAATTQRTLMDIGETLAFAQDYAVGPQHSELGYYQALFCLAEALHRAGCRDRRLIICLARLTRARGLLHAHDLRLSELFQERERMHGEFRKSESELRFALGECSFDLQSQARETLELRANDLTEELIRAEHIYRRALQSILDDEIARAAERHNLLEAQRSEFGSLLPIVDGYLEEIEPDEAMHALIESFHGAKSVWESDLRNRQPRGVLTS